MNLEGAHSKIAYDWPLDIYRLQSGSGSSPLVSEGSLMPAEKSRSMYVSNGICDKITVILQSYILHNSSIVLFL